MASGTEVNPLQALPRGRDYSDEDLPSLAIPADRTRDVVDPSMVTTAVEPPR